MSQTVLVVDDEKNIVNIIAFNLKKKDTTSSPLGMGKRLFP